MFPLITQASNQFNPYDNFSNDYKGCPIEKRVIITAAIVAIGLGAVMLGKLMLGNKKTYNATPRQTLQTITDEKINNVAKKNPLAWFLSEESDQIERLLEKEIKSLRLQLKQFVKGNGKKEVICKQNKLKFLEKALARLKSCSNPGISLEALKAGNY